MLFHHLNFLLFFFILFGFVSSFISFATKTNTITLKHKTEKYPHKDKNVFEKETKKRFFFATVRKHESIGKQVSLQTKTKKNK